MPALGADMEAGTIVEWLLKPGDAVKRGDIIAVVDTEKATIEVEVFQSGIIESIVVPVGQKVPIGTVLALIKTEGEIAVPKEVNPKPEAPPEVPCAPSPPKAPVVPRVQPPPAKPPSAPGARLRVSPLAIRVASELGVNLSTVSGTGPQGAITRADVERAAKAPAQGAAAARPAAPPMEAARPAAPSRPAIAPADRQAAMRKVIAAAMAHSKREIPHYYLGAQIDMSRAMTWLQAENLKRPITERLLYSVALLKAVALAVREST